MAEYSFEKKPKDFKDILDYFVSKQIDGSLSGIDDVDRYSHEIMDMVDYVVKNNKDNKDIQNEIRTFMETASRLNNNVIIEDSESKN